METPLNTQKNANIPPPPKFEHLFVALAHTARWKILKELSRGEPLMAIELAKAAGCSAGMVSKHLAMLRKAGMVKQGRGRLYQLHDHHLPAAGQNTLDFGHCVLRLDVRE